jgi:tol-pal system protein YbgF
VVRIQADPKQSTPPPAKKKAGPTTAPAAPPPAAGAAEAAKPTGDAGLRQRVEQLEEQLVDLQVTIGTLESLARAPSGAAIATAPSRPGQPVASQPFNAAEAARTEQLELQLKALLQQVEQMGDRIRQLEGGRPAAPRPAAAAPVGAPPPSGFGATVVAPAPFQSGVRRADTIGDVIGAENPAPGPQRAASPATGVSPKALYEQAYGYLLARDYGAAETAFTTFLETHPNDDLAGNAQFWLGETHYFRNQFKAAATAYYKGYQTYSRSLKAPDSLLKLALSLDRLNQREAACKSLVELGQKFPNSSPQIKTRALSEAQRMGCE